MKIRIDPLDIIFSQYIRMRAIQRVGGCERCLQGKADYKQLECSHFRGRAKKSTRWDPDNCAGLCFGCHNYLGSQPLEHVEWFKQRLGEGAYDMLMNRSRTPARFIDRAAIKLYLESLIKELE